jgi:myosin heavy subunit
MASQDKLDKEITSVNKLTASIGALTAKFTSLIEEGKDWKAIQGEIGSAVAKSREDFIKLVKSAELVAKQFAADGKAAEGTSERIADLQRKVKSLDSTYSTLVNKTLKELRKEQTAYKEQLRQLAEQEKVASQQEKSIIQQRKAAATQALKEVKERIANEKADKKKLYDQETAQIKELLRLQKNRLSQISQEEAKAKTDRKERVSAVKKEFSDILSQQRAEVRLANEKSAANKKAAAAAEKAAEKQKFFGKAFTDSFSPQAIGKAIASIVKFIGIYEVLGRTVGFVSDFFKDSIRQFIAFDANISKVSAVTGSSGKELEALTKEIRSVAVETRFTASEVAELAVELGKLGLSSREIASLINPIAIAAQATGESLTSVGSALVKVSNQFQLSGAESATSSAILTQAVNKSALTLEDFGVALGYVGPLAAQTGLDFGKTAAILGVLSDNGFSASRAGTGLRGILVKLKKPGEDITETLNTLADANISVEKATELVGRTSAAQLMTILNNIDAVNENIIVQEGFAEQLRATGAQMSSFSGQVDILKSAYAELQLSVGNFLVRNEVVLTLIGALSEKSEELARGFVLIKNESNRLGDAFSKRLAVGIKEGNTELEILNKLLYDSNDENIKKVLKTLNAANPKSLKELNDELDRIQRGPDWANNALLAIQAFSPGLADAGRGILNYARTTDETAKSVKGLTTQIALLGNSETSNKILDFGARTINNRYKEQVKQIAEITDKTKQKDEAIKLSQKLQVLSNSAQKESNRLLQSSDLLEKAQGTQFAGRAKGYNSLITKLKEYTSELKENQKVLKDPTDKFKSDFELRLRSFEIERKGIEDSQRDSEKAFNLRIKQLEDEFQIKADNATTEGELIDILTEKRIAEQAEVDKYTNKLVGYASETEDLTKRSGEFFDEFRVKFEKSDKNFQNFNNKLESWGQALTNLVQQNSEFNLDAQITLIERASNAYADGSEIIDLYTKNLKGLESQYNDTAYGQINLSIAQKKFTDDALKALQKLKSNSDETYGALLANLTAQFGAEQAEILLKPFKEVSDILAKQINKAITDETITPETIKEIKRKLLVLRGSLEDGAGKEDIILKIDITPQEVLAAALDETLKGIDRFNDVAFENTKNRLDRELQAIKDTYEIEDEILQAKLENQLITDGEYRAQVEKNRKKEAQAQNKIEKQIFDAEQKRDRQKALLDYLAALGSIVPTLISQGVATPLDVSLKAAITAGFATIGYGVEAKAINQRKFYPTKFAEGGIVSGPSHAEGGVPFTVRGQGGYEMEGGEYIVNKNSTQKYRTLLDQINGKSKSDYKFAAGGIVKDPSVIANRQIELLEAIASSNITMVGKLDKPVRSFVSATDLRSDENARRIQERNSQL